MNSAATFETCGKQVLQPCELVTLVTALAFISDHLLVCASGPNISVRDSRSRRYLLPPTCVLQGAQIRLVRILDKGEGWWDLLLCGGSKFTCFRLYELQLLKKNKSSDHSYNDAPLLGVISATSKPYEFCDNVAEVFPLFTPSGPKIAVLGCLSRLDVFEVTASTSGVPFIHTDLPPYASSILKSSSLAISNAVIADTGPLLKIARGTVCGDIDIWRPFLENSETDTNESVHVNFKGHMGSIYSLAFSGDSWLLCSASEDRTVRLWNTLTYSCLGVFYGHTARVWRCIFTDDYIISASEDCTCRVWSIDGVKWSEDIDQKEFSESRLSKTFQGGHLGKNIWSLAYNKEEKMIATGGADSGIQLWDFASIADWQETPVESLFSVSLPDVEDGIAKNMVLGSRVMVVLSSAGIFQAFNIDTHRWRLLVSHQSFSDYVAFSDIVNGVAAVGGLESQICVFSVENEFAPIFQHVREEKSKISNIFLLTLDNDHKIVAASFEDGEFWLMRIDFEAHWLQVVTNIVLRNKKDTVLDVKLVRGGILLLSTATGDLIVTDIPTSISAPRPHPLLLSVKNAHSGTSVTSLSVLDDDSPDGALIPYVEFISVGHDGCLNAWLLEITTAGFASDGGASPEKIRKVSDDDTCLANPAPITQAEIEKRHPGAFLCSQKFESAGQNTPTHIANQVKSIQRRFSLPRYEARATRNEVSYRLIRTRNDKVSRGTLEKVFSEKKRLFLVEFHNKSMNLLDAELQKCLHSVACPDSHRKWSLSMTVSDHGPVFDFAFIRKSEIFLSRGEMSASERLGFFRNHANCLVDSLHGREIRATLLLDNNTLLTGSEDTTIHLGGLAGHHKLVTKARYRRHSSVVKAFCWSHCKNLVFSAGGHEELFAWRLRRDRSGAIIRLDEDAVCPPMSESTETRIMALASCPPGAQNFNLVAACSDGCLRFLKYANRKFTYLAKIDFGFCLLAVACCFDEAVTQSSLGYVVATSTRGDIHVISTLCVADDLCKKASNDEKRNANNCDSSEKINNLESKPCKSKRSSSKGKDANSSSSISRNGDGNCEKDCLSYFNEEPLQIQKESATIFNLHMHQSGVNSVGVQIYNLESAVGAIKKPYLMICTAGDDNAVGVLALDLEDHSLASHWYNPHAHSSSVTAVKWLTLDNKKSGFVTASIDRSVKCWSSVTLPLFSKEKMTHARYQVTASSISDVPDISAMDGSDGRLVLAGMGFQIFQIFQDV